MTKQEFIDKYELTGYSYGLGHDFNSATVMSIISERIKELNDDRLKIILAMLQDWITIIDNKS